MGIINIPILQMRKLKHKEVKYLTHCSNVGDAEILTQVVWYLGPCFSAPHISAFPWRSATFSHKCWYWELCFVAEETMAGLIRKLEFHPWLSCPICAALWAVKWRGPGPALSNSAPLAARGVPQAASYPERVSFLSLFLPSFIFLILSFFQKIEV